MLRIEKKVKMKASQHATFNKKWAEVLKNPACVKSIYSFCNIQKDKC